MEELTNEQCGLEEKYATPISKMDKDQLLIELELRDIEVSAEHAKATRENLIALLEQKESTNPNPNRDHHHTFEKVKPGSAEEEQEQEGGEVWCDVGDCDDGGRLDGQGKGWWRCTHSQEGEDGVVRKCTVALCQTHYKGGLRAAAKERKQKAQQEAKVAKQKEKRAAAAAKQKAAQKEDEDAGEERLAFAEMYEPEPEPAPRRERQGRTSPRRSGATQTRRAPITAPVVKDSDTLFLGSEGPTLLKGHTEGRRQKSRPRTCIGCNPSIFKKRCPIHVDIQREIEIAEGDYHGEQARQRCRGCEFYPGCPLHDFEKVWKYAHPTQWEAERVEAERADETPTAEDKGRRRLAARHQKQVEKEAAAAEERAAEDAETEERKQAAFDEAAREVLREMEAVVLPQDISWRKGLHVSGDNRRPDWAAMVSEKYRVPQKDIQYIKNYMSSEARLAFSINGAFWGADPNIVPFGPDEHEKQIQINNIPHQERLSGPLSAYAAEFLIKKGAPGTPRFMWEQAPGFSGRAEALIHDPAIKPILLGTAAAATSLTHPALSLALVGASAASMKAYGTAAPVLVNAVAVLMEYEIPRANIWKNSNIMRAEQFGKWRAGERPLLAGQMDIESFDIDEWTDTLQGEDLDIWRPPVYEWLISTNQAKLKERLSKVGGADNDRRERVNTFLETLKIYMKNKGTYFRQADASAPPMNAPPGMSDTIYAIIIVPSMSDMESFSAAAPEPLSAAGAAGTSLAGDEPAALAMALMKRRRKRTRKKPPTRPRRPRRPRSPRKKPKRKKKRTKRKPKRKSK